jgi:hypothetical protein
VGQRRLRYQGTCILVGGKGYRGYRQLHVSWQQRR